MMFLVVLAFIGAASAQNQFVWDLLNPYLNAAEVQAILANAKAGQDYPNYNQIPDTNFDCSSKKQSGFYADVDAKCQVFHRCDINGNMTSYLCVNTTVFNQITLVCDYYFNVDCSKAQSFENFANSRLYSNKPLFDTPPAGYETPQQKQQTADAEAQAAGQPAAKPAAGGNKAKKPAAGGRNLDNNANKNQVQPGQNKAPKPVVGKVTPKAAATTTTTAAAEETTQAAEDTTAASSEDTTAASSEDTTAASGEDTTAASGEDTTAASGEDTTAAAGGDDTTAASSDDTSAASADDTTAAAGDSDTTAASGDDTSAAGGESSEDTTTAAA